MYASLKSQLYGINKLHDTSIRCNANFIRVEKYPSPVRDSIFKSYFRKMRLYVVNTQWDKWFPKEEGPQEAVTVAHLVQ